LHQKKCISNLDQKRAHPYTPTQLKCALNVHFVCTKRMLVGHYIW
jgi:hypothetical protein